MAGSRSDQQHRVNYGDHGTAIGQQIVNITAAQAEVHVHEVFRYQPTADGFHTRIGVHVDASYAADSLYVRAEAPTIQRLRMLTQHGDRRRSRETPSADELGVLFGTMLYPRPARTTWLTSLRRNPRA